MAFGESTDTTLHATESRVVIKVDIDGKNWHSFQNGTTIRYERFWNNLNKRESIRSKRWVR